MKSCIKKSTIRSVPSRPCCKDLEKKKKSLNAISFNYAIHFDYFTRLKKARSALDMGIATPHFLIMTGVNEDPVNGDPRFTAMGGKKIAMFRRQRRAD